MIPVSFADIPPFKAMSISSDTFPTPPILIYPRVIELGTSR